MHAPAAKEQACDADGAYQKWKRNWLKIMQLSTINAID
jgi:hypothetical protein